MKNAPAVQKVLNECMGSIEQTITKAADNDVYDTKLLTSLLYAKDAIKEFKKENAIDLPFLC